MLLCCNLCGFAAPVLRERLLGEGPFLAILWIFVLGMIAWLFFSGIYPAWWQGESMNFWCRFLCWFTSIQLVGVFSLMTCFCCCMGLFVSLKVIEPVALHLLKNKVAKKIRAQFDEKESGLSGPRRMYYKSEAFKEKCDRIFEEADADNSGTLTLKELKEVTHKAFGQDVPVEVLPIFQTAFDDNANEEIEKVEFMEMCKFFSMMCLPAEFQHRTVAQHYETLSLSEGAEMSTVKKQWYKLCRAYHPDKRNDGASDDVVKADMQEINDAYAALRKHLEEGGGAANGQNDKAA